MNFTNRGGVHIFTLAGGETGKLTERTLVNSGQLVMSQMDDSAAELICSTFSPVSLGPLWAVGRWTSGAGSFCKSEWPPLSATPSLGAVWTVTQFQVALSGSDHVHQ